MNYTELVSSLQEFTENPGGEFLQAIPRLIELAERRIYRDVDLLITRKKQEVALVSGNYLLDVPEDAYVIRLLKWRDEEGFNTQVLDRYPQSVVEEYLGDGNVVGIPRMWAYETGTNLIFASPADSNGVMTMHYTYRPEKLSSTNPETWLSLNAPGTLLYGALTQAGIFLKQRSNNNGEGMKKVYEEEYTVQIAALKQEEALKGNNVYRFGESI